MAGPSALLLRLPHYRVNEVWRDSLTELLYFMVSNSRPLSARLLVWAIVLSVTRIVETCNGAGYCVWGRT